MTDTAELTFSDEELNEVFAATEAILRERGWSNHSPSFVRNPDACPLCLGAALTVAVGLPPGKWALVTARARDIAGYNYDENLRAELQPNLYRAVKLGYAAALRLTEMLELGPKNYLWEWNDGFRTSEPIFELLARAQEEGTK